MLILGLLSAVPLGTHAASPDFSDLPIAMTNLFVLPAGSELADEQGVVAGNITLDGDARDDLFLMAGAGRLGLSNTNSGNILITGSAWGDVWAAARKIDIRGPVAGHVRAASQVLVLDSQVDGNLWAAATTVSFETNALVGGTARVWADFVILRGKIDGNLVIRANKVVLDGAVNGSVSIAATEVSVLSNTRILGQLVCETPTPILPDREAVIEGGIAPKAIAAPERRILFEVMTAMIYFVGAILAGIFFLLFAPKLAVRSTMWMETCPWRTLLTGMAALFLTPVIVFFLLVSLLGLPIALVLGALWGVGAYLGRFVAALALARMLTNARRTQPIPGPSPRLLLMGLALFYASAFLPAFLADAIWLWFTVTGLGGLILSLRGSPVPLLPFPPPVPPVLPSNNPPT
jgi:cytoskeletal protein CcmA (bactofilin family)